MEAPVTDAIIECENLSIGYRGPTGDVTRVVSDVSFSLAAGHSIGIVGESGSGKSTLARALLGYLRGGGQFLGGRLAVAGVDVTAANQTMLGALRGLRAAMVPQNPLASLTYHIPVGRQVEEVLTTRKGLNRVDARAQTLSLFTEMGLPDPEAISARYPHQLSGGQRQRVVIAAALACDPRLLVLDEPTTALDKTTEAQVLDLVQRIRARRKAALLLVTHDLNVVSDVCERVLVMKDGLVMEAGPVRQVFARPATAYTRNLLAASLDMSGDAPVDTSGAAPLLETKALDFTYSKQRFFSRGTAPVRKTLDRIDLRLAPGEVVGIIGESGSGKTTLGLILAGLLAPDQGEMTLEGRSVSMIAARRPPDLRRRMQIVFQDPLSSLNPRHTVGASIARPLRLFFGLNSTKALEKAAGMLAALGLGREYLGRYPRELSGGQQQRVAIARAFAAEPDVLICDEITSALDASVQGQVLAELDLIRRRNGTSVVLITHDLAVIWRMAGRVMVLKDGIVVEQGPTAEVFAAPCDPYTRALLASATRVKRLGQDVPEHHSPPALSNAL